MADQIVVPSFATESEEAVCWYVHREEHDEIMLKAIEEGRTKTPSQLFAELGLKGPRVSVPLDCDDLVSARKQANAKGINADDYVRALLHEALARSSAV